MGCTPCAPPHSMQWGKRNAGGRQRWRGAPPCRVGMGKRWGEAGRAVPQTLGRSLQGPGELQPPLGTPPPPHCSAGPRWVTPWMAAPHHQHSGVPPAWAPPCLGEALGRPVSFPSLPPLLSSPSSPAAPPKLTPPSRWSNRCYPRPLPAAATGIQSEHPRSTLRQPGTEGERGLLAPREMVGGWGGGEKHRDQKASGLEQDPLRGQESLGWTRVNHRHPLPSPARPPAVPGAPTAALPRAERR